MDLIISHTPNPFLLSSSSLTPTLQNPNFFTLTPSFSNRRKLKLRASSTADPNGADGSSWSQSLERASKRFLVKFGDMVKKEIGVDLGDGVVKAGEFVDGVKKNVGSEFQTLSLSEFVEWNRFEHWKAGEFVDGVKKNVGSEFQTLSLSEFVEWNRFEHLKGITRLRSQELQQLIAALLEFMAVCKRAIRVHFRLIGEEDQDFHTQLVNGFQSLTAELSHYIPAILSEL